MHRLDVLRAVSVGQSIHSMAIMPPESHIVLGLADGKIVVLYVPVGPRLQPK